MLDAYAITVLFGGCLFFLVVSSGKAAVATVTASVGLESTRGVDLDRKKYPTTSLSRHSSAAKNSHLLRDDTFIEYTGPCLQK